VPVFERTWGLSPPSRTVSSLILLYGIALTEVFSDRIVWVFGPRNILCLNEIFRIKA
jgi:hypothetical protein